MLQSHMVSHAPQERHTTSQYRLSLLHDLNHGSVHRDRFLLFSQADDWTTMPTITLIFCCACFSLHFAFHVWMVTVYSQEPSKCLVFGVSFHVWITSRVTCHVEKLQLGATELGLTCDISYCIHSMDIWSVKDQSLKCWPRLLHSFIILNHRNPHVLMCVQGSNFILFR